MVRSSFRLVVSLALILALAATVLSIYGALPARSAVGYVVVVDLAHGESPKGLDILAKTLYDGEVYVLLSSEKDLAKLDPVSRSLISGYLIGTFDKMTTPDGKTVTLTSLLTDLLIIPQPTKEFTAEEIQAIKNYLDTRGKAIWLAGDSDYPPGETSIAIVNKILEALGSNLALDYVSLEDPVSNAQAPYRVVALVKPPQSLSFLGFGAEKILMHGPGVVAYRDLATGSWSAIKPDNVPRGISVIAWSSPNGKIVENTAPPRGLLGQAYTAGDTGSFPMVAAQVVGNATIIVSSESPIGDYQPGITAQYYGVMLDGPRFVRNMVLWATGYMGELKYVVSTEKRVRDLEASLSNAMSMIKDLDSKISQLSGQLSSQANQLGSRINDVSNKVSSLENRVNSLSSDLSNSVNSLDSKISGSLNMIYAALGLAVIGLIAGAVALIRSR
ncbi:hypothetical protein ATG_09290 [Desulfurococcaceae archaeon AG1]|nr:hypothetical protein ATG_09290 [Desulfurococcaceae archaeon AG1]